MRRECCEPWVKHASGEGDHEKVVQGGPRDVHQNASESYVAANKEDKNRVNQSKYLDE